LFKAPVSHPPLSQFNQTFHKFKLTGRHYTKYRFSPDIGPTNVKYKDHAVGQARHSAQGDFGAQLVKKPPVSKVQPVTGCISMYMFDKVFASFWQLNAQKLAQR
jgi:hypothetical protein